MMTVDELIEILQDYDETEGYKEVMVEVPTGLGYSIMENVTCVQMDSNGRYLVIST